MPLCIFKDPICLFNADEVFLLRARSACQEAQCFAYSTESDNQAHSSSQAGYGKRTKPFDDPEMIMTAYLMPRSSQSMIVILWDCPSVFMVTIQVEIDKPLGLNLTESKAPGGGLKVTVSSPVKSHELSQDCWQQP
jgi:hypothetical protein